MEGECAEKLTRMEEPGLDPSKDGYIVGMPEGEVLPVYIEGSIPAELREVDFAADLCREHGACVLDVISVGETVGNGTDDGSTSKLIG